MKTITEFLNKDKIVDGRVFKLYKYNYNNKPSHIYAFIDTYDALHDVICKFFDEDHFAITINKFKLTKTGNKFMCIRPKWHTNDETNFKDDITSMSGVVVMVNKDGGIKPVDGYGEFEDMNETISENDLTVKYWEQHNWPVD